MRIIDEAHLRATIREAEAMESAERAFAAIAAGAVVQPAPMHLPIPDAQGEVHVKSAFLAGAGTFTVKVASGFYGNPRRGLQSGSGLMLVFDAATGFPVALLRDNGYLTDLRTAAAGGLAARLLCPPVLERVAVIGSGVQARMQLRALARVRSWAATSVWSRRPEHAASCCRELERELGVRAVVAQTVAAAVAGADLVLTVTPSREPLVHGEWLRPDATVIAVGADSPGKRELALSALLRADRVVPDVLEQCVRVGEMQHAVAAGVLSRLRAPATLGDVLTGRAPGRERDELIVCDLTGTGAQDAAVAEVAWRLAC